MDIGEWLNINTINIYPVNLLM